MANIFVNYKVKYNQEFFLFQISKFKHEWSSTLSLRWSQLMILFLRYWINFLNQTCSANSFLFNEWKHVPVFMQKYLQIIRSKTLFKLLDLKLCWNVFEILFFPMCQFLFHQGFRERFYHILRSVENFVQFFITLVLKRNLKILEN